MTPEPAPPHDTHDTDVRHAPLAPMPLAARASIGRGAATVLSVVVLVGGALALLQDEPGSPVPLGTVLALVGVVGGACALVAVAPWQRWLSGTAQEVLLAAFVAVPAGGIVAAYSMESTADTDSLVFLSVVFTASALTVPLRAHAVAVTLTLLAVGWVAAGRGALDDVAFLLVVTAAVAALAGLAASVLARTLATSAVREEEAAAANRALRAVVDAARTATSHDPQEVLEAVVAAAERLESDLAGLYMLRPDGRLEYGAHRGVPPPLTARIFEPDEGLAGRVLQGNRTVVTNDYRQLTGAMTAYREAGLRAAMGAPIRIAGEPVGVLVAGRYGAGGYDEAAVTAFELLADHAGRALALSRAIGEDRRLLERLQSLHALQEDFVATVSHELRTPLTVIDGLAETLDVHRAALDEHQVDELLSRLRANTTNLTTILTSLLEAARLDRGLVEVEEQVVDLWDLLESCVARLTPLLATHKVQLDLEDALVLADRDLLERVVDNLLTNAQRHTPPGTLVRITSRVTGSDCTVTISDDGPGIRPADLSTITERFTRGGDLHTRSTRGLGLGLALADQVLRLHGTRLHVTSPPGTGAQFRFRLRLAT